MKKKTLNYIHFTKSELDTYTRDKNSCVECVNNSMHISFPPWGMDQFKESLLNSVAAKKIGLFDEGLNGIVLDVRNIKLEGEMSLLRYDTPELHLTVWADFYVFKPRIGVTLRGIVKHVSQKHISVLIFRVFNVSIRLIQGTRKKRMQIGDEISFKVKKFDLQNILPYIEGELVNMESVDSGISTSEEKNGPKREIDPESDTSSSSSESETEEKVNVGIVKQEKKESSDSDDSSDSDNDGQDPARIVQNIKKEPSKTPSPEKSIHRKPQGKSHKSSVSFKDETDLKLPPIDKQIDELINRYSQSSDTDVSSSPTRKKRKTVFMQNNDLTRDKLSPKPASSAYRPSTPIPKKDKSLPSDSDDEEMTVDVDNSISNLLNKVKQENSNKRKTKKKSS